MCQALEVCHRVEEKQVFKCIQTGKQVSANSFKYQIHKIINRKKLMSFSVGISADGFGLEIIIVSLAASIDEVVAVLFSYYTTNEEKKAMQGPVSFGS
jgi:hypothetical protein